jgi:2-polyprenyl-6-hydroxyphenyl methylase/3-demethylubiquinone-9 3-methyltransferase
MIALCIVPIAAQAIAMAVDEGYFHRRRGLPRWERIGHPLDTLSIAACLAWLLIAPRGAALPVYAGLAVISCVFVTKDEPIHARLCTAGEHWLHAILFVLHPIVLAAFAYMWWAGYRGAVAVQLAAVLAFCGYQVVYWNLVRVPARRASPGFAGARSNAKRCEETIDNAWYADLGARWYDAQDTPIALLRAEARHRNPWIADAIAGHFGVARCRVLDVGCGAGLLANALAARGHDVCGLDGTPENLAIARSRDTTRSVAYLIGDAYRLPYADGTFEVACALDLLEHVEDPRRVVAEVARVLAPNGLFFFHTFNRTWLADLIVIKGVAWFVSNTPANLHVKRLFIKPGELEQMCEAHGLEFVDVRGSRPRFSWPLWRMVLTGKVGDDFAFDFTRSLRIGYTGYARKR